MLPAFGLYTHIRANRIRSVFLIGSLFSLVYALTFAGALAGEAIAHDWGLEYLLRQAGRDFLRAWPWVTGGVGIWVVFAYRFNQKLIDMAIGTQALSRSDNPKLYNMLENLCISRGMKTPRLEILETPVPNAYATGVNENQYSITLTRGLIDMLDDAEIEAVLGHELTHIRNGDVRLMIIAMVIAGIVAFFCEMFFRAFRGSNVRYSGGRSSSSSSSDNEGKGKGGAAAALAIAALIIAAAWALSLMIRLALSRSREYLADAGSVELTKNPDAMISALRKIDGKSELPDAPSGIMEMCIDNPRSGFADLFSTHPTIESRIEALKQYAGGHEEITGDRPVQDAPPLSPDVAHHEPPQSSSTPLPPDKRGPWGPLGGLPGG